MKYYSIALFLAIILAVGFFASPFMGDVPKSQTSTANALADKNTDLKLMQVTEGEYTAAKGNSFSAAMPDNGTKGALDSPDAMIVKGKNYLLTQVDIRLKQLSPFRAKIEFMDGLSDTDRKLLLSELNAEIERFVVFKSEINRGATKQDIKNVAEKIKAEWLKSRQTVAAAQGQILTAKENQIISDADAASLGIQKRIDALKAAGKETKAYDKLLTDYSKKITEAKQDVESANNKASAIASAPTEAEKVKLTKEKELLLKSSQDNIRDAYTMLKDEAREDFSKRFK